jgi:hypothetical protein
MLPAVAGGGDLVTRGETDLTVLLRTMRPSCDGRPYVFCCVPPDVAAGLLDRAVGMVREAEGVTLVLPQSDAGAAGLAYAGTWARVTLAVHSDLTAVGFLAAVAAKLAAAGISVNPLAGVYHDHLFVPFDKAAAAVEVLLTDP